MGVIGDNEKFYTISFRNKKKPLGVMVVRKNWLQFCLMCQEAGLTVGFTTFKIPLISTFIIY